MKTTLTVDIDYDPATTDPDSLASAMDRLLKTALSTPGILDEYDNPGIGEFYVMTPPRLVISIFGGLVQNAFGTQMPPIELIVVDWKPEGSSREDGWVEIMDPHGQPVFAALDSPPVSSWGEMAGTRTEKALLATGLMDSLDLIQKKRWVILSDDNTVIGGRTYDSYEDACEDAMFPDCLIVPLVISTERC